jgi:hypothetical protein
MDDPGKNLQVQLKELKIDEYLQEEEYDHLVYCLGCVCDSDYAEKFYNEVKEDVKAYAEKFKASYHTNPHNFYGCEEFSKDVLKKAEMYSALEENPNIFSDSLKDAINIHFNSDKIMIQKEKENEKITKKGETPNIKTSKKPQNQNGFSDKKKKLEDDNNNVEIMIPQGSSGRITKEKSQNKTLSTMGLDICACLVVCSKDRISLSHVDQREKEDLLLFMKKEISWVKGKGKRTPNVVLCVKKNSSKDDIKFWMDIADNLNISLKKVVDLDDYIVKISFEKEDITFGKIEAQETQQNTFFGAYRAYYKLFAVYQDTEHSLKNLYEDNYILFRLSKIDDFPKQLEKFVENHDQYFQLKDANPKEFIYNNLELFRKWEATGKKTLESFGYN